MLLIVMVVIRLVTNMMVVIMVTKMMVVISLVTNMMVVTMVTKMMLAVETKGQVIAMATIVIGSLEIVTIMK